MRKLIVISLSGIVFLLATTLMSLAQQTRIWNTTQVYKEITGKEIVSYHEAPALKVKVAAGELPPVEERLPEEPLVMEPIEEIGKYGGTLYLDNVGGEAMAETVIGWKRSGRWAVRWDKDMKNLIPNVLKGYEFSKDGKTVTLYLRKGLKWSDGMPLTADDVMFWYELLADDEITLSKPIQWCAGGELMKMEKINDYEVRIQFAVGNSVFDYNMFYNELYTPKHYMKKWHIKYNPKAEELAKKEDFESWQQCLANHINLNILRGLTADPDMPVLYPWKVSKISTNQLIYERNPYFWQIDPAGNQLPYIDKVLVNIVTDKETATMRAVSGQVDIFSNRTVFEDIPLAMRNREKGDYHVVIGKDTSVAVADYQFNLNCKDEVLAKIFQDVRFRRAMSLAVDREEINNLIFNGMAVPYTIVPPPESQFYDPEMAKAYAVYDPAEANRLLDEMGLEWDKKREFRLRADGEKLNIIVSICSESAERAGVEIAEMVKETWKKVGVDIIIKVVESGLFYNCVHKADFEAADRGHFKKQGDAYMFQQFGAAPVPVYSSRYRSFYAEDWHEWIRSEGKTGKEPPEWYKSYVQNQLQIFEEMKTTLDKERQTELGQQLWRAFVENVWIIGTVGFDPFPIIVKNRLKNYPNQVLQIHLRDAQQYFLTK